MPKACRIRATSPPILPKVDADAARTSIVAKAKRSKAADRKAITKKTDDGLPVHSFRALSGDLATNTHNTMAMAASIETVAEQQIGRRDLDRVLCGAEGRSSRVRLQPMRQASFCQASPSTLRCASPVLSAADLPAFARRVTRLSAIVAWLSQLGFREVVHLTPQEANARYFGNRRDGLPHVAQFIGATT